MPDSASGSGVEHFPHPPRGRWHVDMPCAGAAVERVDFDLGGYVNVIIDGEVMRLDIRSAGVLPGA